METQTLTLAAQLAKSSKDQLSKTAGYYAAFIALGIVGSSLGPTLPGLAEQTRSHLGEISFLFTARSFGYLVGSLLGGRLYDRIPGHPVMAAVLGTMALTMGIVPLVPLLWVLTGVLFIIGMAEGTLDVGGNTLLVWVYQSEVGPFMNGLHFCFGVGAFLSPIIIAQAVLRSGGITWAYWTLALLVCPVAAWLFLLPSPPVRTHAQEEHRIPTPYGLVVAIGLFLLLYVGAEVGFGGWIFTYATTLKLTNETYAAYLTSAFWGALTIGRLLSVPLAARLKPMTVLISDLVGCVVSICVIVLWGNSLIGVWIGALGLGCSMASIFPTMLTFSERRMAITGQVTGWFFVGASLGGMTLPWVIGQLMEFRGPQTMMIAILFDLLAASLVFSGILVYSHRR